MNLIRKIGKFISLFALVVSIIVSCGISISAEENLDIIGKDRYDTAVKISKQCFESSESVVIVSGEVFPDAISGSNLSNKLNCPILLVKKNQCPEIINDEIKRLNASKAYFVGGVNSISDVVMKQVGISSSRISGVDRYDTNNKTIDFVNENNLEYDGFIVTTGRTFQDAVSSIGVSVRENKLIKLAKSSIESKHDLNNNIVVGLSGLNGIRIDGINEYDTSIKLAKMYFSDSKNMILTSGENFSDALCAISLSKKYDAPIVLSYEKKLNRGVFDYLKGNMNNIIKAGGRVDNNLISIYRNPQINVISHGGNITLFEPHRIDDALKIKILGKSYKNNNRISISDLVYIPVIHKDINGESKFGELIVNKSVGREVSSIFKELYNNSIPIEKIRLVDEYNANDIISMENNNSSAFNFRYIAGTKSLSKHALGLAIDINPLYNPHVVGGVANPKIAQKYVKRDISNQYMIFKNDKVYKIFKKYGWKWGGEWSNPDYQHFEK